MDLQSKARYLRRNQTDVERTFWSMLRNRQVSGLKFRRQVPIGNFIVDFVCLDLKFIIELDGGQHAMTVKKDIVRTKYLESKGYKVIRFWNNEVIENLEGVFDTLTLALSQRERELTSELVINSLPEGEGIGE